VRSLAYCKGDKTCLNVAFVGVTKLTFSTDFQYFEEKAEGSYVGLPGTAVLFRCTFNFLHIEKLQLMSICAWG
jgi:hypothetical protein